MAETINQLTVIGSLPTPPGKINSLHVDQAESKNEEIKRAEPVYYRSRREDLGHFQTIKLFWKASLVCFAAAFSAATDGYQVTLAGNIIANQGFINQFATQMDSTGAPVIAAQVFAVWGPLGSVGQWIGMNVSPYIADRFGRRIVMLSYWACLAISVGIECGARTWGVWAVAKVFSLLGIGAMQSMLQMYISEMSPTSQVRGTMLASYNLWWALGQFFGPLALKIMNDNEPTVWLTPIYTEWIQIGIMFMIYCLIPESPWWLCLRGQHDKAKNVLRRLNGKITGYDVEEEYGILRATVELEQETARLHKENEYTAIFKGVDGWRTLCACWTLVVQQTIGLALIYSYVTYFFILAGQTDPFKATSITAALGVIGVIFIMWGMDKIGRRPIVLGSYGICWVCLVLIGVLGVIPQNSATASSLVAFACIWSFGMNVSGGVAWAYVGEIGSSRLRSRTAGFGASVSVVLGIIFGVLVPYMINVNDWNWGLKSAFFFAGLSLLPLIATYFVIPETAKQVISSFLGGQGS